MSTDERASRRSDVSPSGERANNGELSSDLVDAFRTNRTTIYEIARRVCGPDSAPDVTQEVFLRVWRDPHKFDASRGTLRAYLIVVARAAAIDFARGDNARKRRDDRQGRADRAIVDETDRVADNEAVLRVATALEGLNGKEREVILTAFYDDVTYREVAAKLGIPEGTVKSRIRSGLQRLRSELQDLHPDNDSGRRRGQQIARSHRYRPSALR